MALCSPMLKRYFHLRPGLFIYVLFAVLVGFNDLSGLNGELFFLFLALCCQIFVYLVQNVPQQL